jgi:hypothetical protein
MGDKIVAHERHRQHARRTSSRDSVFLPGLTNEPGDDNRVVVREDVHERALESARRILQTYLSERRRAQ